MVANPNLSMYVNNPIAFRAAVEFNIKYTGLLTSLDKVFNGHADKLGHAIDLMHQLLNELQKLVKKHIDSHEKKHGGPNVGPTYDFTPHD